MRSILARRPAVSSAICQIFGVTLRTKGGFGGLGRGLQESGSGTTISAGDPMPVTIEQLTEEIHRTPTQLVVALSGGGSRAIAELLERPGASRTLLEAIVPYSEGAMIAWLGGRPDQSCSPETARAMAVAALHRARKYEPAAASLAGVGCTAGLRTDRPRRGPHRAHVALQTAARTDTWSLELQKGRRSRAEEERPGRPHGPQCRRRRLRRAVAVGFAAAEGERVEHSQTIAPQPWQDLMLGKTEAVCLGGGPRPTTVVFPGAFHPLHLGHRRMAAIAREVLDTPVAIEMSILNVDKPPLDYTEIERRLAQFPPDQAVWLTRAATFEEKSRLFPRAVFIVGIDTLRRIVAWEYYGGQRRACLGALEDIAGRGCRFLVFGRSVGPTWLRLADLDLPDFFRDMCREIPPEQFREDVSSRAIRKSGG